MEVGFNVKSVGNQRDWSIVPNLRECPRYGGAQLRRFQCISKRVVNNLWTGWHWPWPMLMEDRTCRDKSNSTHIGWNFIFPVLGPWTLDLGIWGRDPTRSNPYGLYSRNIGGMQRNLGLWSVRNKRRVLHAISMGPCIQYSHGPHFYMNQNFDMKIFRHNSTYVDYIMPGWKDIIPTGVEMGATILRTLLVITKLWEKKITLKIKNKIYVL